MPLNLVAREIRLLIGGVDWSDQIEIVKLTVQRLQEGFGLILCKGSIALIDDGNCPWSLDSLIAPDKWKRGTPIALEISDSGGVPRPFPHGQLQILEPPQSPLYPKPGEVRRIEFAIGCGLAAADYDEPDDLKDGIDLGTATSRDAIINNLLAYLGAPALIDPIPLYPLNYPLPKQGGGFLQQAAQLAYGGLQALWQDSSGAIRAEALERILENSPSELFGRIVGVSELEFQSHQGPVVPKDLIRAVGQAIEIRPAPLSRFTRSKSYGPASVVNPEFGNQPIVVSENIEIESVGGGRRNLTIITQEPRGLVIPNSILEILGFEPAGELAKIVSKIEEQIWIYEGGDSGKLRLVRSRIIEPFGKALSEWIAAQKPESISLYAPIESALSRKSIRYDAEDSPIEVNQNQWAPLGSLVQEGDWEGVNAAQLVPSSVVQEDWHELRDGEFKYQRSVKAPLSAIKPEALEGIESPLSGASLVDSPDQSELIISNAGAANPPAPDRMPSQFEHVERFLQAEVRFDSGFGEPRPYTLEVPYPVSEPQLERLAEIEGASQIGARWGCQFSIDIPDELLQGSYSPNLFLSFQEGAVKKIFRANQLTFAFDRTQAVLSGLADYLGAVPAAPPAIGEPVHVLARPRKKVLRVRSAFGLAIQATVYPYPLNPLPVEAQTAFGLATQVTLS